MIGDFDPGSVISQGGAQGGLNLIPRVEPEICFDYV
jgi:hypothetical protein